MIATGQSARPQPTLRRFGLLVCAVLLGLLGMHGLGPVPAGADHPADARMAVSAHTDVTMSMAGECDHGDGGCTGHLHHADATCASASVAGAPAVVPVLLPDGVACTGRADARTSAFGSGPDGGRAPPSLSELQLLRI